MSTELTETSRKPRGPRGARHYKIVNEENTPELREDETEPLRELKSGVFCDLRRDYLYDRVMIDLDDGGKEIRYRKRRLQFSGMPRLVAVYTTEKRGHKARDEETFYKVEFSQREDIAPETFTEREINMGEWLAHWPGLAVTARKDKDFYADILKAQVVPFRLPVGRAKSETGWHQDAVSGLWTYAFRDGRLLTSEPELRETGIPIAGYSFTSSTHGRAWQDKMSQAPERAVAVDVSRLFDWLATVDTAGRQALLCFGAYRSLIDSIERVGMAIMAVAADDVEGRDGSAGAGKTTSIDFARGVDGPCPYRSSPECSFRGTLAGIETRITHTHDLPISVADFHLPESPTESEFSKWAATVDALVSSAADNAEIKERSTKTLDARKGATIGGLLIMDGEKLHPLLLSRLRRVSILFFRRGEIDAEKIHAGWEEYQGIHTSIGHSILRASLAALNKDESHFRHTIRAMESDYEGQLFTRFHQAHESFDKQIARSLAHNFARFITGARLAETATRAAGLAALAGELAYAHMEAQARLLENGGPSTVTREWILRSTRLMLEEGRAHALAMDNAEMDAEYLQVWGYRRTGLVDRKWAANGPHLLNISEDGEICYLKSTIWQELLKAQAQRERLKWTLTDQTFPAALARLAIVEGRQGRSSQLVHIDGKRERRLAVATSLLDIDNQDGEDEPGPPESQPESQPEGHQPGPARASQGQPGPESRQAAACLLLDEMAAADCWIQWTPERDAWRVHVPHSWSDEEYGGLETRVVALHSEFYQMIGQSQHPAMHPPAATQGQPAGPAPASQIPTVNHQGQVHQFGVLFVDICQGQAITEDGARFSFPARCSLSEFLAAATETGPVNRIYLCGALPGQEETPESYQTWLLDPAMLDCYITAKTGHSLAGHKADSWVARYQHRAGGALDIRRISNWLGDDRDDTGQELYSIDDARAALALTTRYLRQHFPLFAKGNVSGSPAGTFIKLWEQGNHVAKKQFPPLPEDIRALIHQNAGQGRIEYFAENCQSKIPGLYYYDGIFMYAALALLEQPTELFSHDTINEYAGYRPARYRIGYRVPESWSHIGPFMTKKEGANWRDKDGWIYPGRQHQGQEFETWVDGCELDVLLQHYAPPVTEGLTKQDVRAAGQAAAFADWQIEIRERIIFRPGLASASAKPLVTIAQKMIAIREQIDTDKKQDTREGQARAYELARGAIRNIMLHGIGSFNREGRAVTHIGRGDDPRPAGFNRASSESTLDDGRQVWIIPASSEADEMTHPELAAHIWALCRARVTRQALAIPADELVTIRTDAIATTGRQESLESGARPGQFRRKWAIEKGLKAPGSHEKFDLLQHKITGK